MRLLLVALLPCLSGCASIADALAPPYVPEPIHVYNQTTYDVDVLECQQAGASYKPHFSFGAVATSAVRGATSDTSLVPLSPLVPVYGAAGGAVGAAADGFDVMSGSHANVFRHCLRDETLIDRSAVLANPREQ